MNNETPTSCRPGRTYTSRLNSAVLFESARRRALVVEQSDPDDRYVELWIGKGDNDAVSVHLDADQIRQLAHDLITRATMIEKQTE